jgi:DNA-binding MarR family transcriptional regulator
LVPHLIKPTNILDVFTMAATLVSALSQLQNLGLALRDVDAEMPLVCLNVFLLIAKKPGISSQDIIKQLDLSQQTASRTLAILGSTPITLRKTGSYGFIRVGEDPTDRRNKVAYLTASGKVFAAKLMKIIAPDSSFDLDELGPNR